MKSNDFKEILKKCFGKEKDEKYHAVAMLAVYGIFILVLIIMIRLGGESTNNEKNNNIQTETQTPIVTPTNTPNSDIDTELDTGVGGNDINYSYSYTITYNGITEVYLGKKLDSKEKFTLIKDGITNDYKNGKYSITNIDYNYLTSNYTLIIRNIEGKNDLLFN